MTIEITKTRATRHPRVVCFFVSLAWALAALVGSAQAQTAASEDGPTTRIVSLVPNLTEIAFTLGAGNQVVGVSDYCFYPDEARSRPKVGGLINPNTEAVMRLRPDVVLLYRSQAEFAGRLRQLGIRSEMFTVDTLADLYNAVDRLGAETGNTTAAAQLTSRIKTGLAALRPDRAETSSGLSVSGLLIVSRDPAGLRNLYQASQSNFLGELFEIAGGRLAIPQHPPVTTEAVIRANPAIIIDFSYAASAEPGVSTAGPEPFPGPWARLNTIPAVQTGAVYKWDDPHALLLGPGVVDTAKKMKLLLEPHR
jgi:iron complex transport system substrate-binding protein